MPSHEPGSAGLHVLGAQYSSAGVKASNDDAVALRIPDGALLRTKGVACALADGVSSAEAGREAAESCVLGFLTDYYATPPLWSVSRSAQRVLDALNQWLCGNDRRDGGHLCTLSVLVLRSRTAHLFQIGDSRIWRLRQGQLECLTQDHTRRIGGKQFLTRAMGMHARLEVDYRSDSVQAGDRFLLTSDGIHEVLGIHQLQQLLSGSTNLQHTCELMVAQALDAGSSDNLSCQIIDVVALPDAVADDQLTAFSQLPPPPGLYQGAILDDLEVLRELHASNRSHLYLVRDLHNGEKMVLKAPSTNLIDDRAAMERLAFESWVAERIHHANLVRLSQPQRPRTGLYFLMEYIDGISLQQWQQQHPRAGIEQVLQIFDQLLNGLRVLHRADVIHADIKPGNVMIQRDGGVKLIDYGSCHARGLQDNAQPTEQPLGVRQYTAPELIDGQSPSERSDLFSVAAMLYELVTGELPWQGDTRRAHSQPLTAIQHYNRYAPPWLQAILTRALSADPDERFHDAAEFRAALSGRDQLDWSPAPIPSRGYMWKWLALALLLALPLSHWLRTLLH